MNIRELLITLFIPYFIIGILCSYVEIKDIIRNSNSLIGFLIELILHILFRPIMIVLQSLDDLYLKMKERIEDE